MFGDGEDGWSRTLRSRAAQAVTDALTRLGTPLLPSEVEEDEHEEDA